MNMHNPHRRRSLWWVDLIMMLVIAASTLGIGIVADSQLCLSSARGGHEGIDFIWNGFESSPERMPLSSFGLPLWAALLLPVSSFLPLKAASFLRWLCMLMLTGFLALIYVLTYDISRSLASAAPFLTACVIQFARTIRLQRRHLPISNLIPA